MDMAAALPEHLLRVRKAQKTARWEGLKDTGAGGGSLPSPFFCMALRR
jgi:hypothetical protein